MSNPSATSEIMAFLIEVCYDAEIWEQDGTNCGRGRWRSNWLVNLVPKHGLSHFTETFPFLIVVLHQGDTGGCFHSRTCSKYGIIFYLHEKIVKHNKK